MWNVEQSESGSCMGAKAGSEAGSYQLTEENLNGNDFTLIALPVDRRDE